MDGTWRHDEAGGLSEELAVVSDAKGATDTSTDAAAAATAANDRSMDDVVARLAATEDPTDERRTHTIELWVHEAAEQFVNAAVQAYVPILVEHIVRQRITSKPHYRP